WHNWICLRKAPQRCIVPTGAIVVQPLAAGEVLLVVLPRVALGGDAAVRPAALAAEGEVVGRRLRRPRGADDAGGGVEVVPQQIGEAVGAAVAAAAHGRGAARTRIVLGGGPALVLVDAAHVDRGRAVDLALHPRPGH